MSVLTILYALFIMPLQFAFEEIYFFAFKFCNNAGLSIIALSFIVNMLVLPLYDRADAMQIAERDIEEKLRKGVDHIKKTFKGDEQLMILQTYYKQNNYNPLDVIKGSASLFLEIPFFVAAYQFLSHLEILNGVPLGPIKDLGVPDGILTIEGLTINIMPIIMTGINLVSVYIFTKDFSLKIKCQLYGMALFFLMFLYDSPAGLVFYWSLNNLFNLIKTIIYKMDNPEKGIKCVMLIISVIFTCFSLVNIQNFNWKKIVFSLICVLLLNLSFYKDKISFIGIKEKVRYKNNYIVLLLCGCYLATITGVLIPSNVIKASPLEFIIPNYVEQPLWYVLYSYAIACGMFLFWPSVFYWLASEKYRRIILYAVYLLCGIFTVNFIFFGNNLGLISNTLKYENGLAFTRFDKLVNIISILTVVVLLSIWFREGKHVLDSLSIALVSVVFMSLFNISFILRETNNIANVDTKSEKMFHLSRNGRNIIVIMLDRAIGAYVPFIFNEKPELKEKFKGFTCYKNVLSHGGFTNLGTPGLYGGYEYIPVEMNKRKEEFVMDKHNEALKVMPVLLGKNGFDVVITDQPYANYKEIPDLSIYKDYPHIKTFNTIGNYSDISNEESATLIKRNFYHFSIVKILPLFLQKYFYDEGRYNNLTKRTDNQVIISETQAVGFFRPFLWSYNVLTRLSAFTQITEEGDNALFITNNATHEPCLLQMPDYVPAEIIDNTGLDDTKRFTMGSQEIDVKNKIQVTHYHVNVAAYIQLGKWFDFLRAQNVYDNSRIIIVSDHGHRIHSNKGNDLEIDLKIEGEMQNIDYYHPVLFVKDFQSKEFSYSEEFMTNADTPSIVLQGLIKNPVNPFTDKIISNEYKHTSKQYVYAAYGWNIYKNNGKQFWAGPWLSVDNDVRDKKNWKLVKKNAVLPY